MERRDLLKAAAGAAAMAPVILVAGTASAAPFGPVLAIITHPVKDFVAWRVVYDEVEPLRQKAGVTGAEVFRDPKTPNLLVIIHRFPSLEAAHAYLDAPALKDAMARAGVTAAPTVVIAVAA